MNNSKVNPEDYICAHRGTGKQTRMAMLVFQMAQEHRDIWSEIYNIERQKLERIATQPDEEPAASHAHEPAPEPTESS